MRLGQNIKVLNTIKSKVNTCILEREKLSIGKKSIKTIFKSTKETETYFNSLQKSIESNERMLEDQLKINACIDIHLVKNIVPKFTQDKLSNFTFIVRQVANNEVKNNNVGADFWSKVLTKASQANP